MKRAVRMHWGLLAAACVGTAIAAALLLTRTPLGVQDEWPLKYIRPLDSGSATHPAEPGPEAPPAVQAHSPLVLAEAALVAGALLLVAWFGLHSAERRGLRQVALGVMLVIGFLFALYVGMAGPVGIAEPAWRAKFDAGIGSYLKEAAGIGPFREGAPPAEAVKAPDPLTYLAEFHRHVAEQDLKESTFRVAVHPPGMTLAVYAVNFFWRSGIRRRDRAAEWLRRLDWPGVDEFIPPDRRPSAEDLTALTMPFLGALAVAATAWLVYALTFNLGGDRGTAFGAAAMWLTVPSVLLHVPALDQLTPLLALLPALCWYRACARRSGAWATAAGLAVWVGFFFTLATAVVVFALGVGTLLWLRRNRSHWRQWPLALWAAGAFGVVSVVAWALLDYNVVTVLHQVARRNAEWNAEVGRRSYEGWLVWNPAMFALFLGPAATTLWIRGWALAGRRAEKTTVARVAVIAVAVTFVVLWLSGQNRGEVERLWSFLMALALVAGAAGVARRGALRPADWLALLALQVVILFVLRYSADIQNVLANMPEEMQRQTVLTPG